MNKLIIIMVVTLGFASNALAIERTERISDREIIESLAELKAGNKAINQRIDDLKTFMLWGFGILFGGIGGLITIVIWDRRTALSPVVKKNKELEEREELIEKILKEYAKVEPKLAEILKSVRFM